MATGLFPWLCWRCEAECSCQDDGPGWVGMEGTLRMELPRVTPRRVPCPAESDHGRTRRVRVALEPPRPGSDTRGLIPLAISSWRGDQDHSWHGQTPAEREQLLSLCHPQLSCRRPGPHGDTEVLDSFPCWETFPSSLLPAWVTFH